MDTSNSGGSQSATAKDTSASAPPSLIDLIRTAVRFYDLAAGDGLLIDGQPDPADYISEFLTANPDAWDRLDSFVAEAVSAKDAAVSVAPLVWVEHRSVRTKVCTSWHADTSVDFYWIERKKKYWVSSDTDGQWPRYFETLDDAKAAAEADHEQRIRAALTAHVVCVGTPKSTAE